MTLDKLKRKFSRHNCRYLYVKTLSPNDNSKNQVYLGSSFEVLNILPLREIYPDDRGDFKETRFKTDIDFGWLSPEGNFENAPGAQLILYPNYPEVRFSGFLRGCNQAPSELMRQRLDRRNLFLGITECGKILGYVTGPESQVSSEYFQLAESLETEAIFRILPIDDYLRDKSTFYLLIDKLRSIHEKGWIFSKRLYPDGSTGDCRSSNCGGYTLEAELGVQPNGFSEPDYLGWEIKQFGVNKFDRFKSQVITLMTPEPNGGLYKKNGIEEFIRNYGYPDKHGRENRINFGGIHKVGKKHDTTCLRMELIGYDSSMHKITKADGCIALVTNNDIIAASWSYSSLLKHWNRKHAKAAYIPSLMRKQPVLSYYFSNIIITGEQTDFSYFLKLIHEGTIYYDPGIKMENADHSKPRIKRRSQFRIKSAFIPALYRNSSEIDLLKI